MSPLPPLSLQLIVPGLVPEAPGAWADALARLPALRRLLARARPARVPAPHHHALLLAAFGIAPDPDWPVAPFTLLADGLVPGEACWLRADPVHLLAQQRDLVLVDGARLMLSAAECDALIATLNTYFERDGLQFSAPHPQRWYLRAPAPMRIRSTPPEAALGRSIDPLLAQGEDALRLHRWNNEIQMLLHDHPVNRQREAQNALVVNSLWLWGAGTLPREDHATVASVWADDPLARGLARASGLPLHAGAPTASDWLAAASGGEHLVVIDALAAASRRDDPHEWEAQAQAVERTWFAPLRAALSSGRLRQLALVTDHHAQGLRFAVTAPDLWKVWRRTVRLPDSAAEGLAHG